MSCKKCIAIAVQMLELMYCKLRYDSKLSRMSYCLFCMNVLQLYNLTD